MCKFICRFFKKKQQPPIAPPPPPPVNQEFYYWATQHLNCVQNSDAYALKIKVPAHLNGFTWYTGEDGFQYMAGHPCPADENAVLVVSAASLCAELNQVLV